MVKEELHEFVPEPDEVAIPNVLDMVSISGKGGKALL